MKIMLDTNILFSVYYGGKVVRHFVEYINDHPKLQLFLPVYAINELKNSIGKKYSELSNQVDNFLDSLNYTPIPISDEPPPEHLNQIRDAKDIPILQAALDSNADILITGDKDFDDVTFENTKIMTMSKFINEHIQRSVF